jgi:chromosome segregation ATPase
MFEESENHLTETEGTPRWMGLVAAALAIISLVGIGMAWNANSHSRDAEQAITSQTKTLQQNVEGLSQRLAQAEHTNSQMQGEMRLVTNKLKLTEGQLATARSQVKESRVDYTKKLDEMQSNVNTQLATKASTEDVKNLGNDVNGVKTDLDSTKNNMQLLRSEHGELIARNHEELDQLRRMGERDYYEFSLKSKGDKQHVGSMQVELRAVNVKKHEFTMALYVDDMLLEKKNKAINEPIFFYAGGSRAPLELVVNQVNKNKVTGYLSAPKAVAASAAKPSGN